MPELVNSQTGKAQIVSTVVIITFITLIVNYYFINFPAAELRGIHPNLALLGKILVAAELRGIRPVID